MCATVGASELSRARANPNPKAIAAQTASAGSTAFGRSDRWRAQGRENSLSTRSPAKTRANSNPRKMANGHSRPTASCTPQPRGAMHSGTARSAGHSRTSASPAVALPCCGAPLRASVSIAVTYIRTRLFHVEHCPARTLWKHSTGQERQCFTWNIESPSVCRR